jgi:hypothetical protein
MPSLLQLTVQSYIKVLVGYTGQLVEKRRADQCPGLNLHFIYSHQVS